MRASLHASLTLCAVALAAAPGTTSSAPRNRVFTVCQDVQSADPESAFNSLLVVQGSLGALGYTWSRRKGEYQITQAEFASIAARVRTLVTPRHGQVAKVDGKPPMWQYRPKAGYVGQDRVSFQIGVGDKSIELRWNLLVAETVNERRDGRYDCNDSPSPTWP